MLTPTTVGLERKCSVNNLEWFLNYLDRKCSVNTLMSGFGIISRENIRLCFFILSTSSWFFSSSPDFNSPKHTWILSVTFWYLHMHYRSNTFCTVFGSILGKSNSCSTQSKLPNFCRCCIMVLLIFLLRILKCERKPNGGMCKCEIL